MSADFWAGYISGIAGVLIGNPLDIVKVRLQAGPAPIPPPSSLTLPTAPTAPHIPPNYRFSGVRSLLRGSAAPALGYGALNSILFVTYNRTSEYLNGGNVGLKPSLWTTWIAGALGGLAVWVVSTPTDLIKCQAQLAPSGTPSSSWKITKDIVRTEGFRGLYFGGVVTGLRDSIGYGWYYWSYELFSRFMVSKMRERGIESNGQDVAKALLCGGLAGVVTWASIFPLDVIKTKVQAQVSSQSTPLLGTAMVSGPEHRRMGAVEIARTTYRNEGGGVFFRGLGVCSLRAFIVNAAQFAVYEWVMRELSTKKADLYRLES